MDKQMIDEFFEKLKERKTVEIVEFVSSQNLKQKILVKENLYDFDGFEYEQIMSNLYKDIQQQIPIEIREYYDVKWLLNGNIYIKENLIENVEEIKKITDEEVEEIIQKYSDDEKLKKIKEEIGNPEYETKIIKSLQSDDKKLDYLRENYFFNDDNVFEIAKTLKSDEAKLEVVNKLNKRKTELLQLIENDEMKISVIKKKYFLRDDEKVEVIVSLKSDDEKIQLLDEEYEYDSLYKCKVHIVNSINDEDKKIEALDKLEKTDDKIEAINRFNDVKNKIKALDKLESDYYREQVIETLDDDDKIEALSKLTDDYYKLNVIEQLENEDKKIKMLDVLVDEEYKAQLLFDLESNEKKLEGLNKLKDEQFKTFIITTLDETHKLELLDNIESEKNKAIIISSIEDHDTKIKLMEKIEGQSNKIIIIQTLKDKEEIFENLNKIGVKQEVIEILNNLNKKNDEVLSEINFEILDDKYINTLGKDKINLLSNYPEEQKQILNLSEKEYELFYRCIDNFTTRNNTDEWTVIAHSILYTIEKKEYDELINNIEDFDNINLTKLTAILQNENILNLKTLEDVENFEQIKKEKCDEMFYNSESKVNDKINAITLKIFGHDFTNVYSFLKYKDIEQIEDEGLKKYIESLKIIKECKFNKEFRNKLYEQMEDCGFLIDKAEIQRDLKTEYCKMYNKGLFDPKENPDKQTDKIEELHGLNVYDAGTDFNMIIHSVGAFSNVMKNDNNYKENWNMLSLGTQQFCTSIIRNDMVATAPRKNVCYGFTDMKEDSLVLAGPTDYFSTQEAFVPGARGFRNEKYYSKNELINETNKYNEVDYRRIQGGEKKQPSYIIAFKSNGKIENTDEIKQAYEDWNEELPVVIVDIDKCLEKEAKEVAIMELKLQESNDEDEMKRLSQEIEQKCHNNQVTINQNIPEGESFSQKVEKIKEELMNDKESSIETEKNKQKIDVKEFRKIYNNVDKNERTEAMKQINNIFRQTKEEYQKE